MEEHRGSGHAQLVEQKREQEEEMPGKRRLTELPRWALVHQDGLRLPEALHEVTLL